MIRKYLFIFLLSINALGFDKDLCHDFIHITGPGGGSGFLSSTEFTSSFGKCSAAREAKMNKISNFILANREQLKNDFSKKTTDTVKSLLQVCSCNEPGQNYMSKYFLELLMLKVNSNISNEQLKIYLEQIFRSDKTLYYGCLVFEPTS
jgi:hypothetical protein